MKIGLEPEHSLLLVGIPLGIVNNETSVIGCTLVHNLTEQLKTGEECGTKLIETSPIGKTWFTEQKQIVDPCPIVVRKCVRMCTGQQKYGLVIRGVEKETEETRVERGVFQYEIVQNQSRIRDRGGSSLARKKSIAYRRFVGGKNARRGVRCLDRMSLFRNTVNYSMGDSSIPIQNLFDESGFSSLTTSGNYTGCAS